MQEFGGFWRWFAHLFERWPPGVPPDPKRCENVSIFDPKTNIFQVKKAGIPSCFLNIFGKKTDDTVQKIGRTLFFSGEKGEHFVLFFCNFGQDNFGHSTKKTTSIPSCFLNIFGEKTDDAVPKNKSEVISQVNRASIPSCFLYVFGEKAGGTVQKKTAFRFVF